jgi:hypothetical protein
MLSTHLQEPLLFLRIGQSLEFLQSFIHNIPETGPELIDSVAAEVPIGEEEVSSLCSILLICNKLMQNVAIRQDCWWCWEVTVVLLQKGSSNPNLTHDDDGRRRSQMLRWCRTPETEI